MSAGLFTANPRTDPAAVRLPELAAIDDAALARASGGSSGGTGGMASKLLAARLASSEGTAVLIAGGGEPRIIERAMSGEDVGTLVGAFERRPARIRHIAVSARHRGALVVNEGALRALGDARHRCCRSASSPSTATSRRATSSRSATAAGACTGAAW